MPAVLWPPLIFAYITLLHLLLPARHVVGYVTDAQGQKLTYRLNGLWVFFATLGTWFAACRMELLAWDAFYLHRWEMAAGACAFGLLFTFAIVLPAPAWAGKSFLAQLYLGRLENPQGLGKRLDAKMVLYLVGAVLLELNLVSFAAHHALLHPNDASPGVLLYVALFSFFLMEYLFFEEVHLYTYDFIAERVGFKLGWGCLVFYPFFYAVGLWGVAENENPHTPTPLLVLFALVFFSGWVLARGANLQKYHFKRDPTAVVFGRLKPEALEGNGRKVLVSGFWGLSRHINYLGEFLMASGLALSQGYPLAWQPWAYPLYYVALLVPRQLDDDRRCAERYGPLWDTYRQRVPWRIIPYVY